MEAFSAQIETHVAVNARCDRRVGKGGRGRVYWHNARSAVPTAPLIVGTSDRSALRAADPPLPTLRDFRRSQRETEMLLYILILMAGYVYIWKKGALDWTRPPARRDRPS